MGKVGVLLNVETGIRRTVCIGDNPSLSTKRPFYVQGLRRTVVLCHSAPAPSGDGSIIIQVSINGTATGNGARILTVGIAGDGAVDLQGSAGGYRRAFIGIFTGQGQRPVSGLFQAALEA